MFHFSIILQSGISCKAHTKKKEETREGKYSEKVCSKFSFSQKREFCWETAEEERKI